MMECEDDNDDARMMSLHRVELTHFALSMTASESPITASRMAS